MNKKEAIAYGQITFENMIRSDYKENLSVTNFGIEMNRAFKTYPKNIVVSIAESKIHAEQKLQDLKNGCDINEY